MGLKELLVIEKDRVGAIADVADALGKHKINILSISAGTAGGRAVIRLVVKDGAKAKRILKKSGFNAVESKALVLKVPDRAGELAKLSRLLADEGIKIKNIYIMHKARGEVLDAIQTSDDKKAKKILHKYLVCH